MAELETPTDPADVLEPESAGVAEVFGSQLGLARRYATFLAEQGTLRGLIGPREISRLWTRHVLNSAVAGPLLPADSLVADIGSGAGLPGIPLALVRPDCRLVLVEPLERRAAFLAEVVALLGLTNCEVVRGRAEQLTDRFGTFDVATSRAVAPLGKLAGWSVPLLRTGAKMLALKGSSAGEEIVRDRAVLDRLGLSDVQVVTVGEGVVDPPTFVVSGVRTSSVAVGRGRSSVRSRRRG